MPNDNKNMTKVQNPSGVVSKCTLKFSFGSVKADRVLHSLRAYFNYPFPG